MLSWNPRKGRSAGAISALGSLAGITVGVGFVGFSPSTQGQG